MLFGSLDFAVFLPLVFVAYWAVPSQRHGLRCGVLLLASLVFYGWWNWRFLSLLLGTALVPFLLAIGMDRADSLQKKRLLLTTSLVINLGLLATFKYFDFFLESLAGAFAFLGVPLQPDRLGLILPIGISFYTFQAVSYSIDVYRQRQPATREWLPFLTYIAFFPQVLSGPIERAHHMLPQFREPPPFDGNKATDGLRQILWGFFKKTVVADNCAVLVNDVFGAPGGHSGSTLLLVALLYSFQIYGDFSGYSDIAIGVARLFGIDLRQNFAYPYFSRDIAEFWRRWHISLSTWFRDYLYIPLGGSRGSKLDQVRNTFVVFLVSGLWHGANWTFVVWGFLHALYFLPLLLAKSHRRHLGTVASGSRFPSLLELGQMLGTFLLVTVAWVFFRADTTLAALGYLGRMLDVRVFGRPEFLPLQLLALIALMLAVEWRNREDSHALATLPEARPLRWACYLGLGYAVVLLSADPQKFIYFQF